MITCQRRSPSTASRPGTDACAIVRAAVSPSYPIFADYVRHHGSAPTCGTSSPKPAMS